MQKTLILATLLLAVAPLDARPAPHRKAAAASPALADTASVRALRRAYQFAFPVYAMMRTRGALVARVSAFGIEPINRLFARATLADATTREVTTPNNDTLYASAWLDLHAGPVRFEMPPLRGRYHSAALMNLFTDNVAVAGSRAGDGTGHYLIAGPDWHGDVPAGVTLLRSDTNDAWLLVRMHVDGPDDLAAASAALAKITLDGSGVAITPTRAIPVAEPDAATLLDVVNEALGRGPLPAGAAARAAGLAGQGIRPGTAHAFAQLPAATQALWTRALPKFRAELKGGFAATGTTVDGWTYSNAATGNFGDDDAARAKVALGGLGALPREETAYITASADAAGAPLDGHKAYVAHLPPKLPVGAFWSLTMYSVEADGRLFFVANPANRFAIGNRSAMLHAERDGSLDIFVQATPPSGERIVNWLPAPKGPFRLVFRAYLPKDGLLDGTLHLPPLVAGDAVP